jgi:hypothetical protein
VLSDFWQTWEIAGVALVDVAVWHWLYDHPDATAADLREAAVRIARDTGTATTRRCSAGPTRRCSGSTAT